MEHRIAYYFQSSHYVGIDWGSHEEARLSLAYMPRPEGCFRCLLRIKPKE